MEVEKIKRVLAWAKRSEHSTLYKDLPEEGVIKNTEDLKKLPTTTVETLRNNAKDLRHYAEKDIRYVSSEFDPKNLEDLFLVPQKIDEKWGALEKEIEIVKPRAALLSIPPFWQVAPLFYHACRAHKIPVSVANPRSPNLTLQVIEGVAMEYAVATAPVMHELRAGLAEKKIHDSIRFWHIVAPLGDVPDLPRSGEAEVSVEYHVFPGIPVAYTSSDMYREDPSWSAPLPAYHYEFEDGACLITSVERHALPFVRFKLPVSVETKGEGTSTRLRFV